MRLDLFPLETETYQGLLIRLMEECAEVQQAASKLLRFGDVENNIDDLKSEIEDVRLVSYEVNKRL